jgi:hypothetical protein
VLYLGQTQSKEVNVRTLIAGTIGLIGVAVVSYLESEGHKVILSPFPAVLGLLGADIK